MTGGGVPDDDMPLYPWSSRGDVPPVGDPAFDALLAGKVRPEDAADGLRPVVEALAALTAAPVTSELAAEASARAVFSAAGRIGEPARSRPGRRRLLTSLLSVKLAAAAAVALGSAAAAAYTGALPAPVQRFAHDTVGAPSAHLAAHPQPAASVGPVGPDATGHAAHGLCTAYSQLQAHGNADQKAVAFRNLATAAGGAARVTAYCARITHPGTAPSANPATHPKGKPSAHPEAKPSADGNGNSSSHGNGTGNSSSNGGSSSHSNGNGNSSSHANGNASSHGPSNSSTDPIGEPSTLPSSVPASPSVGQPTATP
ncbi:MAG TPA: hypothetical protein VGN41_23610 [Streptosporangiaceae bacterium]|jgi:uncharacterized membrane protein YgcG